MNSPSVLLSLLLFYPILFASIFFHELGHAVVGRASGFVIGSFGLGTARPWFVFSARGVRIYFALVRPFQGITFAFSPDLYLSRRQMAAFSAGGILANALAAVVFLMLWRWLPWGGGIWPVAAITNGLLGAMSLIPLQVRIGKMPLRTDGALILQVLRSGTFSAPAPAILQTLDQLRGLWTAIGDTLILRVYLLSAAGAWVDLGDRSRAEALVEEADTLPGACPPGLQALGSLVRAQIASDGRFDDAEHALDSAEPYYRSEGNPAALLLVALCRANLRLLRGDATGALRDLEALAADPLATRHPDLGMGLLSSRLAAAVIADDPDAVRALEAEYEASRKKMPSAARDLQASLALTQFHARRGDEAASQEADRRVLQAIGELVGSWADPEGRAAFLQARSATIEETRLRLEASGLAEEATRLVGEITNLPAGAVRRPENPRLRQWGFRIMIANVIACVSASLLAAATISNSRIVVLLVLLAILLAVMTTLSGLSLLILKIIGRFFPAHRGVSGAFVLMLACFPWMIAIFTLLIILIGP